VAYKKSETNLTYNCWILNKDSTPWSSLPTDFIRPKLFIKLQPGVGGWGALNVRRTRYYGSTFLPLSLSLSLSLSHTHTHTHTILRSLFPTTDPHTGHQSYEILIALFQ
jgi:hypothetical protein